MVIRRQEWLAAVLEATNAKLTELLTQAQAPMDDGETSGRSRDEAALARAGPCAGFTTLRSLRDLSAEASGFRGCGSKQDVKTLSEGLSSKKKIFATLLGSCKTALSELRSAKSRSESAAEASKRKRVKQEEAEAKRLAKQKKTGERSQNARAGASDHAVFQLSASDCRAIPTTHAWQDGMTLQNAEPFIISGVKEISTSAMAETVAQLFIRTLGKPSTRAL